MTDGSRRRPAGSRVARQASRAACAGASAAAQNRPAGVRRSGPARHSTQPRRARARELSAADGLIRVPLCISAPGQTAAAPPGTVGRRSRGAGATWASRRFAAPARARPGTAVRQRAVRTLAARAAGRPPAHARIALRGVGIRRDGGLGGRASRRGQACAGASGGRAEPIEKSGPAARRTCADPICSRPRGVAAAGGSGARLRDFVRAAAAPGCPLPPSCEILPLPPASPRTARASPSTRAERSP